MQSQKSPSRDERDRILDAKRKGCLACHQAYRYRPADYHHVIEGGKRLGHSYGFALCPWHHRGVPDPWDDDTCEQILGPSLAWEPRKFREFYGTDRQLIELQDVICSLPSERTYQAIRWYVDKYLLDRAAIRRSQTDIPLNQGESSH